MDKMGERLKRLRESKGLSQLELGALLGVSNKSVSRYESDIVEPKLDVILKMIDIFGVDANFLLGVRNIYKVKPIVVDAEDIELLNQYHKLTGSMKTAVDAILSSRANYQKEFENQMHFVSEEDVE